MFDCDDAGYGEVVGDGEVLRAQVELAHKAVANCPEGAITLS
jgi:ferredoxin